MSVEEILEEIRVARKAIHAAEDTVQEAQLELSQRKGKRNKCRAELERLLCELENPGQRYPLFEVGNGHAEEDAQVEDLAAAMRPRPAARAEADDPPEFAPVTEDNCLRASLELDGVRDALAALGRTATDAEIRVALGQWPTHRVIPARGPGRPWAVVGGSSPRFFWGELAERTWPAGKATFESGPLVARVRKLLHIGKPAKAGKPAPSK